jgi:hypothetical protein
VRIVSCLSWWRCACEPRWSASSANADVMSVFAALASASPEPHVIDEIVIRVWN